MDLQTFAPPGTLAIISFLAFSSQVLFRAIEPGPLTPWETYVFNALVASIFICYLRTWLHDPGRVPPNWHEGISEVKRDEKTIAAQRHRWCRKCEALKPPRAHHCKTCKRCVPKMDHHCVWTELLYAVASMAHLEYFFVQRCRALWDKRHLPSYLGPSGLQLAHLFSLVLVNSVVLLALSLLLARTIWSLLFNVTTIESWEIERHETLLRRARVRGGYLYGPDGVKMRIERQEFPWDIGIWANVCQGMGSQNPLMWLWPLAPSPSIESGLSFKHNEIEDPRKPWPPPDPDRLYRAAERQLLIGDGFTHPVNRDALRYIDTEDGEYMVRRRPFHERLETLRASANSAYNDGANDIAIVTDDESGAASGDESDISERPSTARSNASDGEEAWRTSEGERLADFGVDEVVEFYDEDDLPLAELMQQRQKGPVA